MSTAIKFENISKQYRLGLVSTNTLSHDLNRWWQTSIRGKEDPYLKIGEVNDRAHKGTSDYVWALKDINFEVQQGDVLGIIGKNGAGKSTLLKILSKVTAPTTGKISARGRIASLLEVGTGFHPEMTGRENIYMNGAIMGMSKAEIRSKFDEIVDFSGVERYIDTPAKRYSSGMTVRLGFAIAAHLEPEILVVDEVLAVGDAEFQKKAIGKMQDVSRGEGRTVLFVSHNMGAVKELCNKGMVLGNGMIDFTGTIQNSIDYYINTNLIFKTDISWNENTAPGNEFVKVLRLYVKPLIGNTLTVESGININLTFKNYQPNINLDATFQVSTLDNFIVFESPCIISSNKDSKIAIYNVEGSLPSFFLNSGTFKINIIFGLNRNQLIWFGDGVLCFEIENTITNQLGYLNPLPGVVKPQIDWNYQLL